MSYSASNNDYVMPGYLDETAQAQWKVRYRYQVSGRVDPAICQTYPWRLVPYLGWGFEPILGYQLDDNDNIPSKGKTGVIEPEAMEVADQPWFGYNAYYVGGWWETNASGNAQCRFSNSTWAQDNGSGTAIPTKGKLVLRTIGRAAQGSSLILFGGSTFRAPGPTDIASCTSIETCPACLDGCTPSSRKLTSTSPPNICSQTQR